MRVRQLRLKMNEAVTLDCTVCGVGGRCHCRLSARTRIAVRGMSRRHHPNVSKS